MNFAKLQGTGNDFVLIDARYLERDWPSLARDICNRHFGVGADGLLLVLSSSEADLRLRMFNPDGSEAEACGNGLRCFAIYVTDTGLINKHVFTVETMAGIREVRTRVEKGIQVTMGTPKFHPSEIPVIVKHRLTGSMSPVIDCPIKAGKSELIVSCISMGNPHAVCFLNQPVADFPLHEVGPIVEHLPVFPKRTNFEVVNIIGRNDVVARVWERGAGETLSCGSGACAIAVLAMLKKLCDNPVDIKLPGGTLSVHWDGNSEVLLSGPAEPVFSGVWQE